MQMTMIRPAGQGFWRVVLLMTIAILVMGRGFMALAADEPKALTDGVTALYNGWADVEYGTKGNDAKRAKLAPLLEKSDALVAQYPDRAEPLIWNGILLGTQAQASGSSPALKLAEKAKTQLEKAIAIDPKALDGMGYTTLGALYDNVPGWPIGFGSSTTARDFLQKGVAISPHGMEANYFYGKFLFGQGQYRDAAEALNNATQPPTGVAKGPGVEGRRADITDLSRQARRRVK